MTLAEFLLARIAEDEAVARSALRGRDDDETLCARWEAPGDDWEPSVRAAGEGLTVVYNEGWPSKEQAAHIALHDRARALAECEAKQQLVNLPAFGGISGEAGDGYEEGYESMLRLLALPYADHPDYNQGWRV